MRRHARAMGLPSRPSLTRFAWLSVVTAIVTITLKTTAYFLTGSVGLLSDALESIVNLVAAVAALIALLVADRPADEEHAYGHSKAEYFSSGFEGGPISMLGLLDTAIPAEDRATVQAVLDRYASGQPVEVHALRTRQAGARRFVSLHVLVPGNWTVHRGHALLEALEGDIRQALPGVTVFTHLESLDDPLSWADTELDRAEGLR